MNDSGMLLDGDGDGAAGGDYSSSFTVAAAPQGSRFVSMPDFVRGPGQDVNVPADETSGIPISISDGVNVRAANIRISYDPALLSISGATAPGGGTVCCQHHHARPSHLGLFQHRVTSRWAKRIHQPSSYGAGRERQCDLSESTFARRSRSDSW